MDITYSEVYAFCFKTAASTLTTSFKTADGSRKQTSAKSCTALNVITRNICSSRQPKGTSSSQWKIYYAANSPTTYWAAVSKDGAVNLYPSRASALTWGHTICLALDAAAPVGTQTMAISLACQCIPCMHAARLTVATELTRVVKRLSKGTDW